MIESKLTLVFKMVRINKSKKSGGNNIGGVKKFGMKRRGPRKSVGVVVGDARYCKFETIIYNVV